MSGSKRQGSASQQGPFKPLRLPAARLLDDLLEAAQTAAVALMRLRESDALNGLHSYIVQVSV